MRAFTQYLTMNVPARMGFVNITPEVEKAVRESGVREGLCLVNAMHITASVFINDDEPGLHEDYERWLEAARARTTRAPTATTTTAPARTTATPTTSARSWAARSSWRSPQGKLDFGPWEQIFYGEFDGRRTKRVLVKVIGE